MAGPTLDQILQNYSEHIARGVSTHAHFALVATEQAVELQSILAGKPEEEQGEEGEDPLRQLIELVHLQASIHTAGLTAALVGLALLGAHGVKVPDPPSMMPPEEGTRH